MLLEKRYGENVGMVLSFGFYCFVRFVRMMKEFICMV